MVFSNRYFRVKVIISTFRKSNTKIQITSSSELRVLQYCSEMAFYQLILVNYIRISCVVWLNYHSKQYVFDWKSDRLICAIKLQHFLRFLTNMKSGTENKTPPKTLFKILAWNVIYINHDIMYTSTKRA